MGVVAFFLGGWLVDIAYGFIRRVRKIDPIWKLRKLLGIQVKQATHVTLVATE